MEKGWSLQHRAPEQLGIYIPSNTLNIHIQYFGNLLQRTDYWKTLRLGKFEVRRRRGRQERWLYGITSLMDEFEQTLGVGDGQGSLVALVHGVTKS